MRRDLARTVVTGEIAVALTAGCAVSGEAARTAGSSAGPSSAPAGTTPRTTPAPMAPYAVDGPFASGTTTLHLADGRRVVVWYPVTRSVDGPAPIRQSIDVFAMMTPERQAKIAPEDRVPYVTDAIPDGPVAKIDGGTPLVVFSHSYVGFPEQATRLTERFASWGFVVAAPDHVERSFDGVYGSAAAGVPKQTDAQVLQATIDLMTSDQAGTLRGVVDPDRVVAAGHSLGAGSAYHLAVVEPRIKAWISYSTSLAGESVPEAPAKPGMVMLGTTDEAVTPADSRAVYEGMRAPKDLIEIEGAGHEVFSDICLIGGDGPHNAIDVGTRSQLLPPSLLKIATDGCRPPHPPVTEAFPAISQLSIAFFRSALGIDKSPVGLDSGATSGLGTPLTVTHT